MRLCLKRDKETECGNDMHLLCGYYSFIARRVSEQTGSYLGGGMGDMPDEIFSDHLNDLHGGN